MIREITLPADAVDMLAGSYDAGLLFQNINAAYWAHSRDNETALHLLKEVHKNFARIADALGYAISTKGQPAEETMCLADFIADFATNEFTLAPRPNVRHPADEPDQFVSAEEVWSWQQDARDLLVAKEAAE